MTTSLEMLQKIVDLRRERLKGYVTVALSELPTNEVLRSYPTAWRVGLDAATTYRSSKHINLRFVVANKVEYVDGLLLTATNVNTDYLHFHTREYHDHTRPSPRQMRVFKQPSGFPAHAQVWKGEAVYFDMKTFYANIMIAFGRGLDYMPNEYLEARQYNMDYPFWHNKDFGRRLHSLANNGGGSFQIVNRKHNVRHIDTPDGFSNPALIRFTQDLSVFICEMLMEYAGSIYGNIDGHIVPMDRVGDALHVLNTIGLPYDVKDAGECEIRGYGRYRFAPSFFNPNGKTANAARFSLKAVPHPYHRQQELNLERFWSFIEQPIRNASGNLLQPNRTPQSLSDYFRVSP